MLNEFFARNQPLHLQTSDQPKTFSTLKLHDTLQTGIDPTTLGNWIKRGAVGLENLQATKRLDDQDAFSIIEGKTQGLWTFLSNTQILTKHHTQIDEHMGSRLALSDDISLQQAQEMLGWASGQKTAMEIGSSGGQRSDKLRGVFHEVSPVSVRRPDVNVTKVAVSCFKSLRVVAIRVLCHPPSDTIVACILRLCKFCASFEQVNYGQLADFQQSRKGH